MKKLATFITAILILSFIIIPTNPVQAIGMNGIIENVEQTNKQIKSEIEKAVYAAQIITEYYNDDLRFLKKNNDTMQNENVIQKLEDTYNSKIDRIVNDLLKVTNKMSAKTINMAAKEGVTVYCQWEEVTLGGRTVLVDPLRIANF